MESAKELWETLENKYMVEDASSKNFLVSQFNNYKMVEECSVLDQLHKIQCMVTSTNIRCNALPKGVGVLPH